MYLSTPLGFITPNNVLGFPNNSHAVREKCLVEEKKKATTTLARLKHKLFIITPSTCETITHDKYNHSTVFYQRITFMTIVACYKSHVVEDYVTNN